METSRRSFLSVLATASGAAAFQNQTSVMEEHPNIALIRRYYAAYATGEPERLREFFASDIQWHIPGHHPLAGTKKGVEEVLAFFSELARGKFKAEPITLAVSDNWVIDLHRGWSNVPDASVDIVWALAFRIVEGKIVEARNFAFDQHAADAFFWKVYPLKPLPDRLAS